MMKLIRWTPRETAYRDTAYQWFDDLWPAPFADQKALHPAMDVIENDNEVVIRVDLPGLSADALDVQVEGDRLTISGEVKNEAEREGERYHYRERYSGSFQRSLRLPNTIDANKVDASFNNGVLNIVLPKLPQAQPKKIDIKATNKK